MILHLRKIVFRDDQVEDGRRSASINVDNPCEDDPYFYQACGITADQEKFDSSLGDLYSSRNPGKI